MGIFVDFIAQSKGLSVEPPRAGNFRVTYDDVRHLFDSYGDLDYPPGYEGRPALAILYVTGVLTNDIPVSGTILPLSGALNRGNNLNAPKESTIRLLASQAAIEDYSNQLLEDAILDVIKYPALPHQSQTNGEPTFNVQPVINGSPGPWFNVNVGEKKILTGGDAVTFSDADITGGDLDVTIVEVTLLLTMSSGPGEYHCELVNLIASGATQTEGVNPVLTTATFRGTINQLDAAFESAEIQSIGSGGPGNDLDMSIGMSDLGNTGAGGAKAADVLHVLLTGA